MVAVGTGAMEKVVISDIEYTGDERTGGHGCSNQGVCCDAMICMADRSRSRPAELVSRA